MPRVFIPAQLRDLTEGLAEIELAGNNLGDVLEAFESRFPGVTDRIRDHDQLSPSLQVSVDQDLTRSLSTTVQPDSEIHFLPAIGGG